MRSPPKNADGRSLPTRRADDQRQQQVQTHNQFITTTKYNTVLAAAALARASAAHIAEELAERRASGHLPTRELCRLLPIACWLHEELAAVAAREGGKP